MENLKEIAKRLEESGEEYERFDDWSVGLRLIRDATHRIFGIEPIASPYDLENLQDCESVLGKTIENYRIVLRNDRNQNFHYYEQNPQKFMLKSIFHGKRCGFFRSLLAKTEVQKRMHTIGQELKQNTKRLCENLPKIQKTRIIKDVSGIPFQLVYEYQWNLDDIKMGRKTYESLEEKRQIHPELLKSTYARGKWKWINQKDYEERISASFQYERELQKQNVTTIELSSKK